MAGNVVQMDYNVIGKVSKGFGDASKILTQVGKTLQIAIGILRALAFLSAGTAAALAQYLEQIMQKVNKLAKICDEFCGDLARAIDDHKRGDYKGKSYFGEGVRG